MCASKHQIIGGRSTAGQNIKRKTTCTIFFKKLIDWGLQIFSFSFIHWFKKSVKKF